MTDITKLSARKLHALIAQRDNRWKEVLDATIAAGMGHLRFSEIVELAKGSQLLGKVRLANDYLNARLDWKAAFDELDARKAFHGSDKPIKKAA